MINVLQRLAELDADSPKVDKSMTQVQALAMTGDGVRQLDVYMEEPDMDALKALSGVKKLNESAIAECGMAPLGAPMPPPSMPASINMSAGNAQEIVSMVRGIMNLAKGDEPTNMLPAAPDHLVGHEPLTAEPTPASVTGPTFGDDPSPSSDMSGDDELADIIRKIKTGEPVKIKTDMPVKVKSDEPIKAITDKLNKVSDSDQEDEGIISGLLGAAGDVVGGVAKGVGKAVGGVVDGVKAAGGSKDDEEDQEDEAYDNTPADAEPKKAYNPNDFAHIVNKVRDLDYTPPGSGSNPMPEKEKEEKKEESFESKLFAEYKKFVSETK